MSRKNQFSLQKLLEVRELVEREKQKELSVSKRKLQTEQENLHALESKRDQAARKMQTIEKGEVSRFAHHHAYLSSVLQSIDGKRNQIKEIQAEIEVKRKHLLEAAKDRKALDKLKDKHTLEKMIAERKSDQAFLDEIALRKKSS